MAKRTPYKNEAGARVPSVTGIGPHIEGGAGGLPRWAYGLGLDGKDYDEEMRRAQDIGTLAHVMIEAEVNRSSVDISEIPDEVTGPATIAMAGFRRWLKDVRFESLHTEVRMVSEEHQYGGTLDCLARVSGEVALVDWKTSAAVRSAALLQVAAYSHAWNELNPSLPVQHCYVLRLGKNMESFTFHWFPLDGDAMVAAWDAFLLCRKLYDLSKTLERAV